MESEQKKKLKFAIFKKEKKKNSSLWQNVVSLGTKILQQARLEKDGFEGLDFFLSFRRPQNALSYFLAETF